MLCQRGHIAKLNDLVREHGSSMTPPLKALGGYSNASSRPSDGFVLLIPTDRADSLYQRLNLSLEVLFLGRRFSVTDLLGFEVAASFFLNNGLSSQ